MLFGVFFFSYILTFGMLRYALSNSLIDIPSARSSHWIPTPRGGGASVAISFLCALPVLLLVGGVDKAGFIALLGAGIIIAITGFVDDHGHVSARWRVLWHCIAAVWVLYWLGGVPEISIFGVSVTVSWVGYILAILYLVWLLNLYNFMDGIDGLAAVETVGVCLAMCLVYFISGYANLIYLPLLLASAVCGFLLWNLPPAKIFMGDVGSGFIGIVVATISMHAAWYSTQLIWCWLILLGVFIVDATLTLVDRFFSGEKIYVAHRGHAYQCASRYFASHGKVTLGVSAINFLWLTPMSAMVAAGWLAGVVGLAISYAPLIMLVFRVKSLSVDEM
ncbi:glycosyltransferase family 4 protein [Pseudomonas sp.]|uniref:MraY family glycosyltransferase n=1 Tax=Pseudomonas sp. TaxID=306 RepID=UPI00257DF7D9|nr:glycosyltransferase family 4 protein [Pseudomonas sp.]